MNIEEIKERLEKEEDPVNFLKELLEKEEDGALIIEIKKLLEEYGNTLENLSLDAPEILVDEEEAPEVEIERKIEIDVEDSRNIREDYGVSVRSDYSGELNSRMDGLKEELANSGLASRRDLNQSAETRSGGERIGEYRNNGDQNADKVDYQQKDKEDKKRELLYG